MKEIDISTEITRFMKRKSTKLILGDEYILTDKQYTRLAKVLEYYGSCKKAENMHKTIATMIKHDVTNYTGRVKRLCGIPGTTLYTQMLRYGRDYAAIYSKQTSKKTAHFQNTSEFWLKQGYTSDQAQQQVSAVQTERSKKSALKTTGTSL